MAKAPIGAPWVPAKWGDADVGAIQALYKGEATSDQQRRALEWIIHKVAATYEMSYQSEKPLDTAFAEGKRFVGNQIIKATKINLGVVHDRRSSRDPSRNPSAERSEPGPDAKK